MNQKPRTHLKNFIGAGLLAVAGLLVTRAAAVQPVLMGTPPPVTAPVAVSEDSTNNDMAVFQPSMLKRDDSLPQPLKFGPIIFRPHPSYQFIFGTGIQSSPGNPQDSVINTLGLGVAVDLGRHWTLDYTPTLRFYSNRAFRDSVDHSASLIGNVRYEDWMFGLSQTFLMTDSTTAETATQTKQEAYNTLLTASHQLNDKFSTDLSVGLQLNDVSGQQSSTTFSTLDWLNYQAAKRLFFGIGGGVGYTMVDGGVNQPDQVYEQLRGRIQWRASEKISFSANVGAEYRQLLASGYQNPLNPVFGASVEYAPFKQTQISLSASRAVSSSDYYIIGQTAESTTVNLNLNQRLLEKFYLNAGLGYTRTDFKISLNLPPLLLSHERTDDIYFFNARLSRSFLKRGNVAVTYQYSDNQSTEKGFTYQSQQVGFEIGFAY